jgi:putative lipoprotein
MGLRPVAVTVALATLVVAVAPCPAARAEQPAARGDQGDRWFARDKALHFSASAGIALGGYGGTALFTEAERPRLVVGGGLALLAGITKEIADHYTGGDPSWRDLTWDVVGTASGLATGWLLHRLWLRVTRGG